jgi:hypothetical protein
MPKSVFMKLQEQPLDVANEQLMAYENSPTLFLSQNFTDSGLHGKFKNALNGPHFLFDQVDIII